MPISTDRFEEIDEENESPSPGTNADKIHSFLAANNEQAFTQSEIAEQTGVKRGSVGPTLVRLREAGRVDHRGQYWRISDHEQSLNDAVAHGSSVAASHESDSFAYDEWMEHAVDPRESREQ